MNKFQQKKSILAMLCLILAAFMPVARAEKSNETDNQDQETVGGDKKSKAADADTSETTGWFDTFMSTGYIIIYAVILIMVGVGIYLYMNRKEEDDE